MTTTVTTVTVTTVTVLGFGATISLLAIIALIGMLIFKETLSSSFDSRGRAVGQVLNVGIVPLLLAFSVIVAARLFQVLA